MQCRKDFMELILFLLDHRQDLIMARECVGELARWNEQLRQTMKESERLSLGNEKSG